MDCYLKTCLGPWMGFEYIILQAAAFSRGWWALGPGKIWGCCVFIYFFRVSSKAEYIVLKGEELHFSIVNFFFYKKPIFSSITIDSSTEMQFLWLRLCFGELSQIHENKLNNIKDSCIVWRETFQMYPLRFLEIILQLLKGCREAYTTVCPF